MRYYRKTVNDELGELWKEVIVYSEAMYQYVPGQIEETQKKLLPIFLGPCRQIFGQYLTRGHIYFHSNS
jgi:hypothetical protein